MYKRQLLEDRNPSYSFSSHNALLKKYTDKVEEGKEGLTEEKNCQDRYDRYLKELDVCQQQRDQAERSVQQYEKLFQETKAELTEKIYIWAHENQELKPEPDALREMTRKIQEYELGEDFLEIRDSVKGILFSKENELNREKLQLEQAHGKAQESFEELNAELESWNNKKDPEPEQPECVRQNRRRLKEQGIPYQQFYKIIEFDTGLTREQADRIEEAPVSYTHLDVYKRQGKKKAWNYIS